MEIVFIGGIITGYALIPIHVKPKPEETMSDKIQMTEEQAKQMYLECGDMGNGWKLFVERMKEHGYILKPEIEQKIEEVEEYSKLRKDNLTVLEIEQNNLIQLLKPYYFNSKEK